MKTLSCRQEAYEANQERYAPVFECTTCAVPVFLKGNGEC
jgi:hypothetical protein